MRLYQRKNQFWRDVGILLTAVVMFVLVMTLFPVEVEGSDLRTSNGAAKMIGLQPFGNWANYSWKVTISNYDSAEVKFKVHVLFKDEDGFVVHSYYTMEVQELKSGEVVEVVGIKAVPINIANQISCIDFKVWMKS